MKVLAPAEYAREFIGNIAKKSVDSSAPAAPGRNAHAFSVTEEGLVQWTVHTATSEMARAGLIAGRDFRIDRDAIGNAMVTIFGKDTSKTVMAGSHLDSVRNGGNHDGVDGVASALAYLRVVARSPKPDTNYTFTIFRAEESSPMTDEACLGSKVMTGMIAEDRLRAVTYGLNAERRELLSDVFGERMWDEILDERSNPWVRKGTLFLPANATNDAHDMEVLGFNELHIEQSDVLMTGRYDAGIVTHIGGSTNRRLQLDSSHLPSKSVETNTAPRTVWKMAFFGKEAHTGGAPHNLHDRPGAHTDPIYRRDALVAACHFLRQVVSDGRDRISIASVGTPYETGFTTVPAFQAVELHAPHADAETIERQLRVWASRTSHDHGVEWNMHSSIESNTPLNALDPTALIRLAGVPIVVEETAREFSRKMHTLYGGDVRGTATDMQLTECGLRMNLNTRDINPVLRDEMLQSIRERSEAIGVDTEALFSARTAVTEHIPLDATMAEQAKEEGARLGLRTLSMPSMPSHDAACMQKAGVPTGMVYETHPGDSHIPSETVRDGDQEHAIRLHHAILDRRMGRKD